MHAHAQACAHILVYDLGLSFCIGRVKLVVWHLFHQKYLRLTSMSLLLMLLQFDDLRDVSSIASYVILTICLVSQMEFQFGGLTFTSQFDSGNLANVEKISKDEEEPDAGGGTSLDCCL